jgi:hypothetical protein
MDKNNLALNQLVLVGDALLDNGIQASEYKFTFLDRGIIQYENVNHFISSETVALIGSKFKGTPVILGEHQIVDASNVNDLAVCFVSDVYLENGYATAKIVTNNKAIKELAMQGKAYASCAYEKEAVQQSGIHNSIEYNYVITDGIPNHITISSNQPRYTDAKVVLNNLTDEELEEMGFLRKKEDKDEVVENKEATPEVVENSADEKEEKDKKEEVAENAAEDKKDEKKDEKKEEDKPAFNSMQEKAIKNMIADALKNYAKNSEDKEEDKKEDMAKNSLTSQELEGRAADVQPANVIFNSNPNNY